MGKKNRTNVRTTQITFRARFTTLSSRRISLRKNRIEKYTTLASSSATISRTRCSFYTHFFFCIDFVVFRYEYVCMACACICVGSFHTRFAYRQNEFSFFFLFSSITHCLMYRLSTSTVLLLVTVTAAAAALASRQIYNLIRVCKCATNERAEKWIHVILAQSAKSGWLRNVCVRFSHSICFFFSNYKFRISIQDKAICMR